MCTCTDDEKITEHVTAIAGDNVQLQCPGYFGNERISWWRNRSRLVINGVVLSGLENTVSFDDSTGVLIIQNVGLQDSAIYQCVAGFDEHAGEINLRVIGEY